MKRRFFNNKITIEKEEKFLDENNIWNTKYTFWKNLWASILLKEISSRRQLYLFCIRWMRDFPSNFRVKIGDKIFVPTQFPALDPPNGVILFHAVIK